VPKQDLQIKSLGTAAKLLEGPISRITLLGSKEEVQWSQAPGALTLKVPAKIPNDIAIVFKVTS
jgi:alpha-L-fucosidase